MNGQKNEPNRGPRRTVVDAPAAVETQIADPGDGADFRANEANRGDLQRLPSSAGKARKFARTKPNRPVSEAMREGQELVLC